MNLIGEFFELVLLAAIHDAQTHTFVWDGPDSRIVARRPDGGWHSMIVPHGELVCMMRDYRVLFQPIDSTRMGCVDCVIRNWTVN